MTTGAVVATRVDARLADDQWLTAVRRAGSWRAGGSENAAKMGLDNIIRRAAAHRDTA